MNTLQLFRVYYTNEMNTLQLLRTYCTNEMNTLQLFRVYCTNEMRTLQLFRAYITNEMRNLQLRITYHINDSSKYINYSKTPASANPSTKVITLLYSSIIISELLTSFNNLNCIVATPSDVSTLYVLHLSFIISSL